jgi:tRNA A-37 threonylcarbamoyl transferase component Bud32
MGKAIYMQPEVDNFEPIEPPSGQLDFRSSQWAQLPATDLVINYLATNLWSESEPPLSWEAARFSKAVYLYRETKTHWAVIVKFYSPKTGSTAEKNADRERRLIGEARSAGLTSGRIRAIRSLGTWRGVLFLEYADGLSLADMIAIRQSQPGVLNRCLTSTAELLARLHSGGIRNETAPNNERAFAKTLKYVDELTKYGVLKDEAVTTDGLQRLINTWIASPKMEQYIPTVTHGDATTTNFIFPSDDGVVAIDWERLEISDPATDLGRLAAEVSYSIIEQGGNGAEAAHLLHHLFNAYHQASSRENSIDALIERARFYQAASTLRIARNGWIPRPERTALVAQAMALLVR